MNDLSRRISALSPQQLKLLKERLKDEQIDFEIGLKEGQKRALPAIEPGEKKEFYLLSSVQKRLFFLDRLGQTGILYNVVEVKVIEDNLDRELSQETFKRLICRHESFRTSFKMVGEEPVQCIQPAQEIEFEIEYFDLSSSRHRTSDNIINNFVRPFDLSRAPLLRVGLIKEEDKRCLLVVDMHHIMSDALSKGILWNEFTRVYRGERLAPLRFQYRDFACWQNSETVQAALKQQQEYWLGVFAAGIPVLKLPIDYERPAKKSYDGGCRFFKIGKTETAGLKALALKENTTIFAAMFAIYNVFLSKISRQTDVVVGVPIAGRRHAGLDRLIGMFVNTLALNTHIEPGTSFKDFLRSIRHRLVEAFENQDYQFEDLVNQVVKARDAGRNPIFDVFFSFRAAGISLDLPQDLSWDEDPGRQSEKAAPVEGTSLSMFDLYFYGAEVKEELILGFTYSAKLFKRETIARFVRYIRNIISELVQDDQLELADIKISHDLGSASVKVSTAEERDFGF